MPDRPDAPTHDPSSQSAVHPGPVRLVDTPGGLEEVAATLAAVPRVALDIEANGLYAYREKPCLVQWSVPGGSYVVDPLALGDLSTLARALDREDVEVVLHGGDFDISLLTRDHGFVFHRVFDTMIAAQLLGREHLGLAALVFEHFGVALDKRFQKMDWSKRPLTAEQMAYLHRDTVFLLPLREKLLAELVERDLEEEASIEFARLAERRGQVPVFDPDGWRRLKGATELDARGRSVLAALFRWRDEEAVGRDVPPFKVVGPRTLVRIAREASHGQEGRDPARALSGRERRHAADVRAACREGLAVASRGEAPPRRVTTKLSVEDRTERLLTRRAEDALRAWRRKAAAERGVPNLVVLPNPALEWLARRRPKTLDALDACPDIGPKRRALYGDRILRTLEAP